MATFLWDRRTEKEWAIFKNISFMVEEKIAHPITKMDDYVKHIFSAKDREKLLWTEAPIRKDNGRR